MIRLRQMRLRRGVRTLIENADLDIFPGQRVVLTGANGSGKSSFFEVLLNQLEADQGTIEIPDGWVVSHMAQEVEATEQSVIDYVLDGYPKYRELENAIEKAQESNPDLLPSLFDQFESIHGYQVKSQGLKLLHGLGFQGEEPNRPVKSFSGGWRIRMNLARALLLPSDFMLLDEPTNHLDLDATFWLESYLKAYSGTLILISHDRDFIDGVATHILNLEQQGLSLYSGNYSQFERQRAAKLEQQQLAFEKQQERKAHLEKFVTRFKAKASKAKQAQSRIKQLEKMEKLEAAHVDSPFEFSIPESDKISDPLMTIHQGEIGYGDKPILSQVKFSLHPGQTIGLLGPNGAGKSTLIKMLSGEIKLSIGEKVSGENLRIGYFAQHQLEALDLTASPLLQLQRLDSKVTEQSGRNYLGGFGFHGDKSLEPCGGFSGGEQARLALALMCWEKPNLLLLDEPTNHLDLEMRHALTLALQAYSGAMVIVSHDRHLLNSTVDEFWMVNNGEITEFDGTLEDYGKLISQSSRVGSTESEETKPKPSIDRKEQKRLEAEKRAKLSPIKKQVAKFEKQMENLQQQLETVEAQLADSEMYLAENKDQLQLALGEQRTLKAELDDIEMEWLSAQEELEALESSLN